MTNWPVSLQQKLNVAGFEVTYGNTLVRTDMDVGPAKVRSRFTDAVDVYTCTIHLDIDEKETLDTFFKTTLGNGANQFLFDDPFSGDETAFRFVGQPKIRPLGGRVFEVGMVWERMP